MAKRLSDEEVEKGIVKLARDRDISVAAATRFLCGIGLVRLRALSDYASKQEQKAAIKKIAKQGRDGKKASKQPEAKKEKPAPSGIGTSPSKARIDAKGKSLHDGK